MATPTTTPAQPVADSGDYIVKTPGICSGQPRIAGTRIKVKHVYTWIERMGMTPSQVVAEYPHLTLAQVHAALAYYQTHRDEIHQDLENEEKLVAELKARMGPSKLQERLARDDAADHPIPPAGLIPNRLECSRWGGEWDTYVLWVPYDLWVPSPT
jgi:uncharacterized protein (DUF433 family)